MCNLFQYSSLRQNFNDKILLLIFFPTFFIALTAMIIGIQLFLAGFIAELVNRNAPDRNTYLVEEKIGFNS